MKPLRTLVKRVCGKLFADFVQSRLLAEYPDGVEIGQHQVDRPTRDYDAELVVRWLVSFDVAELPMFAAARELRHNMDW